MATKKKTKKKPAKLKKVSVKKSPKAKKPLKKKRTKKPALAKHALRKTRPAFKKIRARIHGKSQSVDTVAFEPKGLGSRSGGQSGDLQGLSNVAGAASESVDELLEEGNSFEAELVKGVEDAGDDDEGEVHTHEVPQDDVPGEYLDKD